MDLPTTFKELKDLFISAQTPELSELDGEYLVDMLTIFPSLKKYSHRKIFYRRNDIHQGHNIVFNKKWGYFHLEEGHCSGLDNKNAAIINYNRKENLPPLRGIRDHIRCLEKERTYIGRFNYLISGRLFFLGYFSLEKIRDNHKGTKGQRCKGTT